MDVLKEEYRKECIVARVAKSVCVHADTLIHIGPCVLTGFIVSSEGGNTWVKIYDGRNTNGELKYNILVPQKNALSRELVYPVDFDKGIYVDVESGDTYITVEYIPESWKSYW